MYQSSLFNKLSESNGALTQLHYHVCPQSQGYQSSMSREPFIHVV